MDRTKTSIFTKVLVVFMTTCLVFSVGFVLGGYLEGDEPAIESGEIVALKEVYNTLATEFYYGENSDEYREKLLNNAIRGMVEYEGNPYTTYMSAEEASQFNASLTSGFVGIGVSYSDVNDEILVLEVLKNSPAENAGIEPGDYIIGCDGLYVENDGIDAVLDAVSGEAGTVVVCYIQRNGEIIEFSMIRSQVADTVSSTMVENVGILTIDSFSQGMPEEAYAHLCALKEKNAEYLIIDLRNNGGGYAYVLGELSAFFMNDGDVIMIEEDRDGNTLYDYVKYSNIYGITGNDFEKFTYKQIVVLVNESSASCSEVFTMAMRENCDALVVGVPTYGKGEAQITKTLPDGSSLKYTDYIWKSGYGFSVSGTGIIPDVEAKLDDALYLQYMSLDDGKTLQADCVDYEVMKAQYFLKFLGYDVDRQDGYFSEKTREAICSFQRDQSMQETGIIDDALCGKLNSAAVKAFRLDPYRYDNQLIVAIETVKGN